MRQRFKVIDGKRTAELDQKEQALGDLPPFEEALLAHLDSLFAFALRLVKGQRAQAEDLVQEVCLRAFRSYRSLRSPERFKAWFFQILVNTHINESTKEARRLPIVDLELSEELLASARLESAATPEELMFEHLLDSEVREAFDALPLEFAAVVWLSDVEGLSYKEISGIVNCPMGTVASRLYRAHCVLREQLRGYAECRGLIKE